MYPVIKQNNYGGVTLEHFLCSGVAVSGTGASLMQSIYPCFSLSLHLPLLVRSILVAKNKDNVSPTRVGALTELGNIPAVA